MYGGANQAPLNNVNNATVNATEEGDLKGRKKGKLITGNGGQLARAFPLNLVCVILRITLAKLRQVPFVSPAFWHFLLSTVPSQEDELRETVNDGRDPFIDKPETTFPCDRS